MSLPVVVFGAGMVLLGLEVAGGHLLTAAFGSSVYVWASVITVFMTALSVGFYAGGAAADRWPVRGALGGLLLAAGVSILALRYHDPVVHGLASMISDPRAGPLAAGTAIFILPSALLGAVGPFALRLSATRLGRLGSIAGTVNALSSAGGVAGALLTAFVLIPVLQLDNTLRVLGWAPAVLALMLVPRASVTRVALTAGLAAVVLTAPAVRAPAAYDLVYEQQSVYHRIRVVSRGPARYMAFNRSFQGGMYLNDPYASPFAYTDYVDLAWVFHPAIRQVLVVGLGAGAIPKRLMRDHPGLTVDTVELDAAVRDVASRFFAVKEDAALRVIIQDGRRYLMSTGKTYDLIVLDAYHAEGIPFHLATREFLELAAARLSPGGVVVANIVGAVEGDASWVLRALYKTYAEVFPSIYLFPVGFRPAEDSRRVRTNILIASRDQPVSGAVIASRVEWLSRSGTVKVPRFADLIADHFEGPIALSDVPVLTDNYAPIDVLPIVGWEHEARGK